MCAAVKRGSEKVKLSLKTNPAVAHPTEEVTVAVEQVPHQL